MKLFAAVAAAALVGPALGWAPVIGPGKGGPTAGNFSPGGAPAPPAAAAAQPPKREPSPGLVAPLTVEGPYTLVVSAVPFRVTAPAGYKLYAWKIPPGWDADAPALTPSPTLTVTRASGAGEVQCVGVKEDWTTQLFRVSLSVGATPPPQPPGPGPTPPGPGPQPPPGPLTEPVVLVVYETADLTKYPPGQLNALYAKEVQDRLDRLAKGRWRIWDKDTDPTGDALAASLKPLLARPRQSLPWLLVADKSGTVAFEGPVPASPADMLALLDKLAGGK